MHISGERHRQNCAALRWIYFCQSFIYMAMTRRTSLPHKQPRRSGSGPRSFTWEYEERGLGFVSMGVYFVLMGV